MAVSEVTSGMSLRGKERGRLRRREQHKRWRANRIRAARQNSNKRADMEILLFLLLRDNELPFIRYRSVILLAVPSIKIIRKWLTGTTKGQGGGKGRPKSAAETPT